MTRRWSVLFLAILLATLVPATSLAADPVVDWIRQFGTTRSDYAMGITTDGVGRIAVAGYTDGTLPGQVSEGGGDAFVRAYLSDGSVAWTRQFGTRSQDTPAAIALDGVGRAYVAGYTRGTFAGQTRRGRSDAFVRVYRPDGSVARTWQFGTKVNDQAYAVAVDGRGRVYVAGRTDGRLAGQTSRGGMDAFVRRYRPDGTVAWTRQFGSRGNDNAYAVAVDASGRIAVAGYAGEGRAARAFVRVYRRDGRVAWTRQFGTSEWDNAYAVAVDASGRVYVAGSTNGTLPGQTSKGGGDGFVRKYRPGGRVAWTRQFGTSGYEAARGIAVAEDGRIFVVGMTSGTLPGQTNEGGYYDAFVRMYGPDGRVVATAQFGTSEWDEAHGVTVDGSGRVAVSGFTEGTFPGQTNEGYEDAFVRSYVQP